MKTRLHVFQLEPAELSELVARLEAEPGRGRTMRALGKEERAPGIYDVEIEPSHIFSNQWNTTDSRVFDFYIPLRVAARGTTIPTGRGHWLELTPELLEARARRRVCGWCGFQADTPVPAFHTGCIGSEYLKASELHLLRFLPVADFMPKRAPLTDQERDELAPIYEEKQREGAKARAEKMARDQIARAEKSVRDAETKAAGLRWLADHGVTDLGNWIYYSHTGRWCYGWRTPIQSGELPDILTEAPFEYDVKWAFEAANVRPAP